ncbi:gem-associated protein 5 [Clupea harengus]|uniref:Gem-associated protein 5 n=1 Tax=Clupea harengus TaxID=7950 RepID=A0A6P8FPA3_CLUHA|nr:gem-associated protein 5 [Clupea harengus]
MHERLLPPSPNWYCSRCSDTNAKGILGFGARNSIYLVQVTAASPIILGELSGHKERVSGFVFSPHHGEESFCASTSDDKTVKIWDIEKRVVVSEHNAHEHTITAVDWSPKEKTLVVTGDEKGVVMCFWHNSINVHSFMPQPRAIFCLTCSPHNENHVAIGYKDGLVAVIDISKKGAMIHRLRGHDDEIHALAWCPQPGEEGLYSRPEDGRAGGDAGVAGTEPGGGGGAAGAGCFLASGSKDQTVRIWSTDKGKGIMTFKLPFLKRRGAAVDPGVKERIWLTVHWPKGMPTHVVTSCFGGELVLWDLARSEKPKWTLLGASADSQNHNRIVFNLSSAVVEDTELLISTSMDREIKCWSLSTLECCWSLPTLGGFVYSLSSSPVASGLLAVGVGDNMIRVWNTITLHRKYDTKLFWQGIRSKVTALSWHPTKEAHLAFGTDDGKVGIYDVFSNKPPHSSSTYHKKTVYTIAWGPPVPPLSFGADKPSSSLYSCGGDGIIFQHDPWKLAADASNIDKLICDTNQIKHKLSPHTDFNWKPDGKVLAVGNEDGSIGVFAAPDLKQLCTIEQHHKIINTLRWHHAHSSSPDLHALLASGSSNAIIYVHNLHCAIESPGEQPVSITEAFRSLEGHTSKITGLDWSPHHDARLVTVCYDGTAQVWDVMKDEPLHNYRGHRGRLLCVQWSSVEPELVWTGGDDFTVHEWSVSKQEHTKPPKGKRAQQFKAKMKKKKKLTGKGGMRIEDNESPVGEVERGGGGEEEEKKEKKGMKIGSVTEETEAAPSSNGEGEEEEERGSISTTLTPGLPEWRRGSCSKAYTTVFTPERFHNGERDATPLRKEEKRKEKPESSLKRKKQRSLLPLSTSMDHRPRDDLLRDCVTLASYTHTRDEVVHCVPGSGEHIQLGLFSDRDALQRMLEEEERSHVEGGHYESMFNLRLWRGQEVEALKLATEKGELNDYLISVAPMAGFRVWFEAVEAYVKQLSRQDQHLKAATHLLSIGKFYDAVSLLKSHHFYREAIAMAKARLRPDDLVLVDLYMTWAEQLERDGHYTAGAKCYLAVGRDFDAAKIIGKKGDVASLRAAATLARVSGHLELSRSFSLRCAKDLAAAQDWRGAQEVLQHESLLGNRLLFSVNELLVRRLSQVGVVTWTPASTHDWSVPCAKDFLQAVEGVWQQEFDVSASSPHHLRRAQEELGKAENPPTTANVPLKQLLSQVALDVSLSMLSWLLGDGSTTLEHFLRAVVRGSEAANFTLMAETCVLLFPRGLDSLTLYPNTLDSSSDESSAVLRSLEAFICYQQLYRTWWAGAAHSPAVAIARDSDSLSEPPKKDLNILHEQDSENGTNGTNGSVGPNSAARGQEELCGVLLEVGRRVLSEPHAVLQASQPAIAEVQRRVTDLVQQHSRGQEAPPGSEETQHTCPISDQEPPSQQHTCLSSDQEPPSSQQHEGPSSGAECLPALIAAIAEHNKAVADMPEHVKKYPFPDVLECCIVILYLATPEHPTTEALRLLHKYGASLRPAWQRFI